MSRLKGLNYNPESSKRPLILAQATIDIVYDRLGPGLTEELRQRRKEIFDATGKAGLLQQFLTEDIGHPALQQHLTESYFSALRFQDDDWDGFRHFMDRVSPPYNRSLLLPFRRLHVGYLRAGLTIMICWRPALARSRQRPTRNHLITDEQALQWYSGDSCTIPSSSEFYGESGTDSSRAPKCPKCPLICSTTEPPSSLGF